MSRSRKNEVCARVVELRKRVCGPRGKSNFARLLGISPSTYDYYEADRSPPLETALAIADLAGVDVRWLVTGREPVGPRIRPMHPVVQRAAKLLADHPNAAPALAAFLDILGESMRFPPKSQRPSAEAGPAAAIETGAQEPQQAWIPILSRSAAGVPHFWAEGQDDGVTKLGELIGRHTAQAERTVQPARTDASDGLPEGPVEIVTLTETTENDVSQFVAAPGIKALWPDAFAVRIDGDSMAPYYRHGDLVVLSPSAPAENGRPAVVQLAGQIGVTCKIYRRSADEVHLVPINRHFEPESFPAKSVAWALRVLAAVRAR